MDKQIILAGWLIDGTGAAAIKNQLLTIRNGSILSIGPAVSEIPYGNNLWLDLSEHTVFPTLFDCHTHMALSGVLDPACRRTQGSNGYQAVSAIISGHVQNYLNHGVLCSRDGGDRHSHVLRYKMECADLNRIPFQLQTSGNAWHRDGRYGKFIGRAVPGGRDPVSVIEKCIGQNADHVKVIQSGLNSLSMFGKQTEPQFEKDAISRIFSFCRSRGIGLMIHANGEKPVGIAIDGGCDSIEHGFFMGEENLKKMADARVTWVPTTVTMKAYAEHAPVDSPESQVARKTLDHQLEQLLSARRYGVRVALGTDAGSPGVYHGKAVVEELGLLVSAGYSIEAAIECATRNAAVLMNGGMTGRLGVGDPASFVAVKGSPSGIPERLSVIDVIMASGRLIVTSNAAETTGPIHE